MLDIISLTHKDIDTALRLSTQAGWNQIRGDWQRLINLWPDTCFAGWQDGQLIATGTVAQYECSVGWAGMILVDKDRRGRGVGTRMLEHAVAAADGRGVTQLGLDATDLGRPLYQRQGFIEQSAITRWTGAPGDVVHDAIAGSVLQDDWPGIFNLDRAVVGVDRGALLQQLAGESGSIARLVKDGDRPMAFGFARRGREASAIGPVVGQSLHHAQLVFIKLLGDCPADVPILVDVLEQSPLTSLLPRYGFTRQRRLTRMVRPDASWLILASKKSFIAAGLELG